MKYETLDSVKPPGTPCPSYTEDWETARTRATDRSRWDKIWTNAKFILIQILINLVVVVITLTFLRSTRETHVMKTYGTDMRYMSLDKKYDFLWDKDHSLPLLTLTKETATDPAAIGTPGLIAMFHDLHCLSGMRTALQKAHYGEKPGLDYKDNDHWPHCMHHLRQSILCRADDTVEVMRWNNGTLGAPNISGVTDVRKCGSSDALYKLQSQSEAAGLGVAQETALDQLYEKLGLS